ncbi:hypothetical protein FKM82_018186 [Ascaphus truei]
MDVCKLTYLGFLCYSVLLLTRANISVAETDCTEEECEPPVNCIEEVVEDESCCPTCVQFGCTCEGYQYYDCVNVGFKDGKVPEGESYFVDFGSTECSCPHGGGRISCHFIPCPELPPNCIDFIQPSDGCIQCGRIGCIHGGEKYEAGHTFHMSLCKFCHCPNSGGELMCYAVPQCGADTVNTTQQTNTEENDPERQYDYPYSNEQDTLDSAHIEIIEKNNNYKRNAMHDASMLDYEDNLDEFISDLPPKTTPVQLTEHTTPSYEMNQSSQHITPRLPGLHAYSTDSGSTVALSTSHSIGHSTTETTTQLIQREGLVPRSQTQEMVKEEEELNNVSFTVNSNDTEDHTVSELQVSSTQYTIPPFSDNEGERGGHVSLEITFTPTPVGSTVPRQEYSQAFSAESKTVSPRYLGEGAQSHIFNYTRLQNESTKDIIETCCAIGQQWSMDHGECENIPARGYDSEVCRLAEKQCCISYGRENTCIAGMIAAKEGGTCFPAGGDICERSFFKLCCDCCSMGLKIKKEGNSCEANLNLGDPCSHMMVSCCNGEEELIPPDMNIHPRPQPTAKSEQDMDECVMNLHTCIKGQRCVNTVESFLCLQEVICEHGYDMEDSVCKDINECTSIPEPCKQGFNCLNTMGSYVCQRNQLKCNRGYQSNENGTKCIDIDECDTGVHNCSAEQSCHNLPGIYRCDCKIGYRYESFKRMCIDINECWMYPGRLCHHTCDNVIGSYQCSCFAGFQLSHNGKHCEDVNECENNPCNQECTNVYGSYQCYCKEGYKLADDGFSCQDIDECIQSIGGLCIFRCVNTPGSYQCACPDSGYTVSANGRSCKDIDECEVGTHNCSSSEDCYNIQGTFKCLAFNCPENFRRVSNMRCERITCFNYQDCQNTPVRISYHRLNFPTGVIVPAQIFRISPSPAYAGDNIVLDIKKGNEENYFSTRKLNPYTGILYLQRPVRKPTDFLLDVEMKLWRQGMVTAFLSKIYIFITAPAS